MYQYDAKMSKITKMKQIQLINRMDSDYVLCCNNNLTTHFVKIIMNMDQTALVLTGGK